VTKRAKIIIGAVIAVLLILAGLAAMVTNMGTVPAKSSNQIKAEIEKAFEGKDYFKSVSVKSYSGLNEETDADVVAKSAAITLTMNKMDAASFKEATSLLPKLEMIAFYSLTKDEDIENIISVTGFKNGDFKDEATVNAIADSLKVQETYKGSYWQISRGNAEGDDATKMKTQFVTKETAVPEIRKTVDAVLTPKMDVLPVAKTELSKGSFAQFAAVDGKMTNYDKGLEIGLKFADATFLDGDGVTFLGLGDDIQISYNAVREGLDKAKLTEIANELNNGKELNKEQLFKITVVSPEDAAAAQEEASPETSAPTESAQPSESASATPSAEATPSPSESGK
jgi:hypothetical protein